MTDALETLRESALHAMAVYGRHHLLVWNDGPDGPRPPAPCPKSDGRDVDKKECTCGLDAAIAALKEQPLEQVGAGANVASAPTAPTAAPAVGRIARQGWHRPWCWQQWARSLADSEMGSSCTCSAALKEQPHE